MAMVVRRSKRVAMEPPWALCILLQMLRGMGPTEKVEVDVDAGLLRIAETGFIREWS